MISFGFITPTWDANNEKNSALRLPLLASIRSATSSLGKAFRAGHASSDRCAVVLFAMRCTNLSAPAYPSARCPTLNPSRITLVVENSRGLLGGERSVHIGSSGPGMIVVHWGPGGYEVILRQARAFHSEASLRVAVTRSPRFEVAAIEPIVVGCPPHI